MEKERKAEMDNSQSPVENKTEMETSDESVNSESGRSKMLKIKDETETRDKMVFKIVREYFLQHQTEKAAGEEKEEKEEKEQVEKNPEEIEETERIQIDLENEVENETPTAKALKNPLVVKMIIGNLDVSSLLSCRLVNKLWLALCTEILSKSRDENDGALRIAFHYCEKAGSYIKYFDGILRGEIKTLESFNQFLEKVEEAETADRFSLFPCTNFDFEDLNLSQLEIQRFFELQGSKIKGLRLDFRHLGKNAATTESFTDLLMHKAPNVECLTLSEIPFYWKLAIEQKNPDPYQCQILNIKHFQGDEIQNTSQDLPSFSLGKLRCLRICDWSHQKLTRILLKEIALASAALKTILIHPLCDEDFDYLTSIPKWHLVTEVNLTLKARNLQNLKHFAKSQGQRQGQGQGQPRLKHLTLSLKFVDSTRALNVEQSISFDHFVPLASALLESSKDSLQFFSMPQGKRVVRFLQHDDFPILKNVRVVGLHCRERQSQVESPIPAKTFQRIFPNARELTLFGQFGGEGGILTFTMPIAAPVPAATAVETIETIETLEIQEKDVIPQITILHLFDKFTRQFLNNIPLIFPNVVELFLCNINLLPVLPLIWRFGSTSLRLKVLELEICMDRNPDPNFRYEEMPAGVAPFTNIFPVLNFPQLDAAITGFPEEACFELFSMYPEILNEQLVKEIRINPSILDLKDLEQLRIKFWILREAELPENIVTVVSGAYAFGRMKSKPQENHKLELQIETKVDSGFNRCPSAFSWKKKRSETILKPLLPYAKLSFTIHKR